MKLFSTLLLSLLATSIQAQDNFAAISGSVTEEVEGIQLPALCNSKTSPTVAKTMFTIEPASSGSTTITILTSPPDLVTASVGNGKLLLLTINEAVATTASEGGVKIQIPNEQFQKLDASASARVQVLSGFTSLSSITAASSASVRAVVETASSGGSNTPLTVSVTSSATLDVQYEGGEIERAGVSSSGKFNVVASTVKAVDISSSGSAQMRVDNPISSGSVSSSGRLSVSANGSCDNLEINSSGNCQDGQDVAVTVTVGEPYTMTGTENCPCTTCTQSTSWGTSGAFSALNGTGRFLSVVSVGAWLLALL